MPTIAQNLQRLQTARTAIAKAITDKGGQVPSGDGLEEFAADISTIAPYEMTGELPLVFKSDGENSRDYTVYGNYVGIGERTANLCDWNQAENGWYNVNDNIVGETATLAGLNYAGHVLIPVSPNSNYVLTFTSSVGMRAAYAVLDTNMTLLEKRYISEVMTSITFDLLMPQNAKYLSVETPDYSSSSVRPTIKVMLNAGSTALPYEPYGYKIPITCGNTTTNLYTPTQLAEGDTLTYADTQIAIPTVDGVNTLDTTLDTKFSMDIQYGDFPIYDNINAAINTLKGTETTYKPADMADAIIDAIPTEEVTDSIVSVTDAAAYPAEALEFAIEPVQDLHGYDKPWPGGGGKNLINVPDITLSDAGVIYSGTINLPAGTYTLSSSNTTTSVTVEGTSGVMPLTFTLATAITSIEIAASAAGTFNNIQLELGSTATSYEPYSNICP